jgi:hypothetical protein
MPQAHLRDRICGLILVAHIVGNASLRVLDRVSTARSDRLVRRLQSESIRQHTSACVSIRDRLVRRLQSERYVSIRQHASAYVSIRQHTSAYVSIRQHTSAYGSIRDRLVTRLEASRLKKKDV